ncbi:MAG: hypothetical protein E2O54_15445 [Gammaproteobacteria bacterium]|nr:MAG: hypothetical protein E2O54_15445 [Gammaproteobacteria bacterium]
MTNPNSKADAVEALAGLYHSWITGLVLTILNRRDASLAEEFVFQLFRRQHLQRFLPGLEANFQRRSTPMSDFDSRPEKRARISIPRTCRCWI